MKEVGREGRVGWIGGLGVWGKGEWGRGMGLDVVDAGGSECFFRNLEQRWFDRHGGCFCFLLAGFLRHGACWYSQSGRFLNQTNTVVVLGIWGLRIAS